MPMEPHRTNRHRTTPRAEFMRTTLGTWMYSWRRSGHHAPLEGAVPFRSKSVPSNRNCGMKGARQRSILTPSATGARSGDTATEGPPSPWVGKVGKTGGKGGKVAKGGKIAKGGSAPQGREPEWKGKPVGKRYRVGVLRAWRGRAQTGAQVVVLHAPGGRGGLVHRARPPPSRVEVTRLRRPRNAAARSIAWGRGTGIRCARYCVLGLPARHGGGWPPLAGREGRRAER